MKDTTGQSKDSAAGTSTTTWYIVRDDDHDHDPIVLAVPVRITPRLSPMYARTPQHAIELYRAQLLRLRANAQSVLYRYERYSKWASAAYNASYDAHGIALAPELVPSVRREQE